MEFKLSASLNMKSLCYPWDDAVWPPPSLFDCRILDNWMPRHTDVAICAPPPFNLRGTWLWSNHTTRAYSCVVWHRLNAISKTCHMSEGHVYYLFCLYILCSFANPLYSIAINKWKCNHLLKKRHHLRFSCNNYYLEAVFQLEGQDINYIFSVFYMWRSDKEK